MSVIGNTNKKSLQLVFKVKTPRLNDISYTLYLHKTMNFKRQNGSERFMYSNSTAKVYQALLLIICCFFD